MKPDIITKKLKTRTYGDGHKIYYLMIVVNGYHYYVGENHLYRVKYLSEAASFTCKDTALRILNEAHEKAVRDMLNEKQNMIVSDIEEEIK